MTLTRSQTSELLARHGLAPRRSFGQNFVVEPETVRRIAVLARVGAGDRVLEIGAGLGALTIALAETGALVTAVEIDDGVVRALRDNVAALTSVRVVHDDAMRLDYDALLRDADSWTVVANLPYNVATPLVADLLDGVPRVRRLLVMVQKEVAQRFVARPGDEAFGAVSVKVAYWATARIVGEVSWRCSCRVRASHRRSWKSCAATHRRCPRRSRRCSRSCARGSRRGARCCAARSKVR